MTVTEPIPGPKALPFVGNLLDLLDDEAPLRALEHLAAVYGPVYKLSRQGKRVLIVSSAQVMEEICDEARFVKAPPGALTMKGDDQRASGLFTATSDDPDWGQAHRILMPAFGPLAIEGQFGRKSFSLVVVVVVMGFALSILLMLMLARRDAGCRKPAAAQVGADGA